MSWNIDNAHTQVQFTVRHMMISKVRGQFEKISGEVNFEESHPENTSLQIKIATDSINTREQQRDAHLKSPDFFNSKQYPEMVFTSKRTELVDKEHARLIGDLTIRDFTNEVVLDVEYVGKAKSPWGKTSVGFAASTKINREDWGLTWNQALETGGMLVSREVEIAIEIELTEAVSEPAVDAAAAG
jgi:polyisoprenoid-binding protein YceI